MPRININIPEDAFLPVYQHTLNSTKSIEFLYGSRDSGKSRHIAQIMVMLCIGLGKRFTGVMIRKVFNTVKDSQWQMIKEVVDDWKLDSIFKFTTHPLEIHCASGGKFVARGCDDPKKLKSLTNPSHAWVEEGTDLTAEDWTILTTSLRSSNQKTQIWFSFNPDIEDDYEDFWMWKLFFQGHEKLTFTNEIQVMLQDGTTAVLDYGVTHSTFYDNPFCPPERKATYENLKDPYEYMVYAQGMWGRRKTGGEFLSSFVFSRHAKPGITYNLNALMRISIDNNVKPYIAVTAWQVVANSHGGWIIRQVNELPGIQPDNRASRAAMNVVRWLRKIGYVGKVVMHGDKSTKSRNTIDDNARSFYQIFVETLENNGFRTIDGFLKFAPSVVSIGDFVNAIFDNEIPGLEFEIGNHNKLSIKDYIATKTDKDGTILKTLVKEEKGDGSYQKNGHFVDTLKDFTVQSFYKEYQAYCNRHKKLKPGGVIKVPRGPKVTL